MPPPRRIVVCDREQQDGKTLTYTKYVLASFNGVHALCRPPPSLSSAPGWVSRGVSAISAAPLAGGRAAFSQDLPPRAARANISDGWFSDDPLRRCKQAEADTLKPCSRS